MAKNRQKISMFQLMDMFSTNEKAEEWFIKQRWPKGVSCIYCGSFSVKSHKTHQKWRCTDCRKNFNTKTGTLMQGSNLSYKQWAIAIYLMTTSLKGIASTRLASELGITQKSAWAMAMKIRQAYNLTHSLSGEIEVDETYIGGKESNRHIHKRKKLGSGVVGKEAVLGMKQRDGKVIALHVPNTTSKTLQGEIKQVIVTGSTIYTDDHRSYIGLDNEYKHVAVKHSVKEYAVGVANTNSIESFWALLKRGYHGTHHYISPKHLHRYVMEFAGRANDRKMNTTEQMAKIAVNMEGQIMTWDDLVA